MVCNETEIVHLALLARASATSGNCYVGMQPVDRPSKDAFVGSKKQ